MVRVRRTEPVFLRNPNLPSQGSDRSFLPTPKPAEARFGPVLSPNSEHARVQSSEKGTGLSPNSKPAEPGFGPVLTPNSEPARVRSSEKGTGLSPNSKPAEPGLYPFFLRTPNLPNQGYTRSFSELKLQTPSKNTILDHLVYILRSHCASFQQMLYSFFKRSILWCGT